MAMPVSRKAPPDLDTSSAEREEEGESSARHGHGIFFSSVSLFDADVNAFPLVYSRRGGEMPRRIGELPGKTKQDGDGDGRRGDGGRGGGDDKGPCRAAARIPPWYL